MGIFFPAPSISGSTTMKHCILPILILALLFSCTPQKESQESGVEASRGEAQVLNASVRTETYFSMDEARLPLSFTVQADSLEAEIQAVLSKGYAVLDYKVGDINGDARNDLVLILKQKDEKEISEATARPVARPLLLIINEGNHAALHKVNTDTVLCVDCGGIFGDPYDDIAVKGDSFTIQHMGGSNARWTRNITFVFDAAAGDWFLHRIDLGWFHLSDPGVFEEKVLRSGDFGTVRFIDFKNKNFPL
jgi:hypothetical protein